jgi:hypothetical protein
MSTREPLRPGTFFSEKLSYIDGIIDARNEKLREPLKRPQVLLYANFRDRYEQIFLGYSLGESVDGLAARFPIVVESYESYIQSPKHEATDIAALDDYVVSLWLVSFAILFRVDDSLWQRLLACIGNDGRDALFEALAATRSPNRAKADGLLHPRIFQPLMDAIGSEGKQRSDLVKEYLSNWYKALGNAYWIGTHVRPDGAGFFGYWAVEVAGIAKAFGMDDAAFRDMPYYPRDLIA